MAVGINSHAEGGFTIARSDYSYANGLYTQANGKQSFATGYGTEASGHNSTSFNQRTIAKGYNSAVFGESTEASCLNQFAFGSYNTKDNIQRISQRGTYIEIVGNGYSENNRSNARTLDWSGNQWLAGTIEASALILRSTTSGSTKKFRISVDDTGALSTEEVV